GLGQLEDQPEAMTAIERAALIFVALARHGEGRQVDSSHFAQLEQCKTIVEIVGQVVRADFVEYRCAVLAFGKAAKVRNRITPCCVVADWITQRNQPIANGVKADQGAIVAAVSQGFVTKQHEMGKTVATVAGEPLHKCVQVGRRWLCKLRSGPARPAPDDEYDDTYQCNQ